MIIVSAPTVWRCVSFVLTTLRWILERQELWHFWMRFYRMTPREMEWLVQFQISFFQTFQAKESERTTTATFIDFPYFIHLWDEGILSLVSNAWAVCGTTRCAWCSPPPCSSIGFQSHHSALSQGRQKCCPFSLCNLWVVLNCELAPCVTLSRFLIEAQEPFARNWELASQKLDS